jgi:putative membrane protein
MRTAVVMALMLVTNVASARAQQGTRERGENVDPQVANPIKQIHEMNMKQAMLGKMAQTRGSSKEVRDLGSQMERKHAELDRKTIELARKKGVDVSLDTGARMNGTRELETYQGEEFDREFLRVTMRENARLIERFSSMTEQVTDPEAVDLVRDSLGPLLDEYEKASKTLANMGAVRAKQQQQQNR